MKQNPGTHQSNMRLVSNTDGAMANSAQGSLP